MSDDSGYELVMPFVVVASQGGPYDDIAYTAGYEAGLLSGRLQPPVLFDSTLVPVRADNVAQLDLIAMFHNCHAEFADTEDDEWKWCTVTPVPP